jgi:hypothetical protein
MVVTKPYQVGVQYALESTWGTAVVVDTPFGRVRSAAINFSNNKIPVQGAGAGRNKTNQLFGNFDVNWNVDQDLHVGTHLQLGVGKQSGSGTNGDPYDIDEQTTISSTTYLPFTLEVAGDNATDEGQIAEGCVCNQMVFDFAVGATVKVRYSGVAETVTSVGTPVSFTEPTTLPFIASQITVDWGSSPTTIGRVTSGQVTINQNLVTNRTLGSRFINQPELGQTEYGFTLTVLMSDSSYETLRTSAYGGGAAPDTGISNSGFPVTDELHIDISEGSSSGDRTISIELDECVIDSVSQPVNAGNNLIQVTFTGTANKGKDAKPIKHYTTS